MRADYSAALVGCFYAERNREYPLLTPVVTIGRAHENTLRIDHPGVAENHARIVQEEDSTFVLEVQDPEPSTALNGDPIRDDRPRTLAHGDMISLAELQFRFTLTPTTEALSRIRVLAGVHRGKVFRVEGESVCVGRAFDNDLQFPDRAVSRHHCRIRHQEAGWWIEDLESTNGTIVNGRPVQTPVELQDGDEVLAGFSRFVFHLDSLTPFASDEERYGT